MLASPALSRGFNLKPHCATPLSEGSVSLRSADPRAKPIIDPCYLSDTAGADLSTLVAGIQLARAVVAQPAFDELRGEELMPGPSVVTEEELRSYVRAHVDTGYHPGNVRAIATALPCGATVQRQ